MTKILENQCLYDKINGYRIIFHDKVHFKEMSKEHILSYLNKGKKTFEQDKSQKWIGTYNGRQMILLKLLNEKNSTN